MDLSLNGTALDGEKAFGSVVPSGLEAERRESLVGGGCHE